MLYAPGAEVTELGDNRYSFTFKQLEAFREKALGLGFQYFNLASVGGRKSWKESTILVHGMPAMSYEAYRYLAQYLPALEGFLAEKGWLDPAIWAVSYTHLDVYKRQAICISIPNIPGPQAGNACRNTWTCGRAGRGSAWWARATLRIRPGGRCWRRRWNRRKKAFTG